MIYFCRAKCTIYIKSMGYRVAIKGLKPVKTRPIYASQGRKGNTLLVKVRYKQSTHDVAHRCAALVCVELLYIFKFFIFSRTSQRINYIIVDCIQHSASAVQSLFGNCGVVVVLLFSLGCCCGAEA